MTQKPKPNGAIVAPLIAEHVVENFDLLMSYATSARESFRRQNFTTGKIHFEAIRLIGKEIATSIAELEKLEGGE